MTNPNGTTATKVYDDAGRLSSITNRTSGGVTLSSYAYGYNACNERTSCTEANGDVVSYGYSAAHRLTSESRTGASAYTQSWTLDGVGNRTGQSVNGVSTTFAYSTDDELGSASGGLSNSYAYNANGEQVSRTLGGTAYTLAYDYEGQLTSITQGASVTSFAYGALGRRFSRTAGGVTTSFLSAGSAIVLEKQGTSTTAAYTYGNSLIRKDGEVPLYDGLGTARGQTNASQAVTSTLTPDAFGQTVASSGSTSSRYGYAGDWGYRSDGDAGLVHVGARYYDAQVGRFASRDTYLDQHPYLYCEHDPVGWVDPSGHRSWSECWDAVRAALGGLIGGSVGRAVGARVGTTIGAGIGARAGLPGAAAGGVIGLVGGTVIGYWFPDIVTDAQDIGSGRVFPEQPNPNVPPWGHYGAPPPISSHDTAKPPPPGAF